MPQTEPYILIYHTQGAGGLEWATKYHHTSSYPQTTGGAEDIANVEALLCDTSIVFNRWEGFSEDGIKQAEGTLAGIIGLVNADMMPIHYCLLIRLQPSAVVGRPSCRYIHGFPESFQTDGVWNATGATALAAYESGLDSLLFLCDSDGQAVQSYVFRGFSRRRRMRRAVL